MRALLDVNLLIALLDPDHTLHETAMSWFVKHAGEGWASCPITQNGCVRIMSNPSYPSPFAVRAVLKRLAGACQSDVHEFWPDDVSLLDTHLIDSTRIHGPRQITDVYLLALAVRHGGHFVTFDTSVSHEAVIRAEKRHVLVL